MSMKASDLIRELEAVVDRHGDLPVTLAIATYEYSIGSVGHTKAGPLPDLGDLQKQDDLPERIVIEGKMQR
jgi:hypothetical protein